LNGQRIFLGGRLRDSLSRFHREVEED
jgi:hypothetical protein